MAAAAAAAMLASVDAERPPSAVSAMGTTFKESALQADGTREPDTTHAGVGILLHAEDGAVHVKTCVKGGAAHRDGRVLPGDVIAAIDGRNALKLALDEVRAAVVGPQGSFVTIRFERRTTGETVDCRLLRGTPDFLDANIAVLSAAAGQLESRAPTPSAGQSIAGPTTPKREVEQVAAGGLGLRSSLSGSFSNLSSRFESLRASDGGAVSLSGSMDAAGILSYSAEAEVGRLRNRVSELEAENVRTKEEVLRAHEVLEIERQSNLRFGEEVNAMQRKYEDHIRELQMLLEQNEQVRRETEAQLQSHLHREEEMGDMFRQAQDQVEARERYFAEMRTSYEHQLADMTQQAQAERDNRERAEEAKEQAEQALGKLTAELERIRAIEKTRREMEEKFMRQMMESNRRLHDVRNREDQMRVLSMQNLERLRDWQDKFFAGPTEEDLDQFFLA